MDIDERVLTFAQYRPPGVAGFTRARYAPSLVQIVVSANWRERLTEKREELRRSRRVRYFASGAQES